MSEQFDPKLESLLTNGQQAVLVTLRRGGRAQLSNILYAYDPETRLARVSLTADRAKTKNIVRDDRVSLHVTRKDFWAYVVADGIGTLSAIVQDPHDEAADALVDYYRTIRGEHPDWDEYRRTQVTEQRQLLTVTVDHLYGMARDVQRV